MATMVHIPNYGGVKFIGTVGVVLGFILIFIGLLLLLFSSLGGIAKTVFETPRFAYQGRGFDVVGLIIGLILILVGIVNIGMGQLFYCVRDIARNSTYLQKLQKL